MPKQRSYEKEYRDYHGTPEQIANRASRNAARAKMEAKVGKEALKGKDVSHRDNDPTNNNPKNLKLESPSVNRARKTKGK